MRLGATLTSLTFGMHSDICISAGEHRNHSLHGKDPYCSHPTVFSMEPGSSCMLHDSFMMQ